jgi:hypothetical protein
MSRKESAQISIMAPVSLVGSNIKLILKIYDSLRSDLTTVSLFITKKNVPTISIDSNNEGNKFPFYTNLKLLGRIEWSKTDLFVYTNISWKLNNSIVNLADIALTSTYKTINLNMINSLDANTNYIHFNLLISSQIPPIQSAYTFSLVLSNDDKYEDQIETSITIIKNQPPIPGVFSIDPVSGSELSTSFSFYAYYWDDQDLPLSYVFSYRSFTNEIGNTNNIY